MTEPQLATARSMIGDFMPTLAALTDDLLISEIWERSELAPRDRSLITIAALVAGGNTEQLGSHIERGLVNGLSQDEIKEIITHLAFYAGWPRSMSAAGVARRTLEAHS